MSDSQPSADSNPPSEETIRILCPNCGSKLNAKMKLLGQSRPCPKCKEPVKIVILENHEELPSLPLDEPAEDLPHLVGNKTTLANVRILERLDRNYRYWILDRTSLLAAWENDGHGWMLKTHTGMVPASRNAALLPVQGDFKMVEMKLEKREQGMHLLGLAIYQLAPRWALVALPEGDDPICHRVASRGTLNREQKFAVRRMLREKFMPEVWENAKDVLEFLSNTDFHSHGVG